MTRKRSSPGESATVKEVGFVIKGAADDVQRLIEAVEQGKFKHIPIEQPDGSIAYVDIAHIDRVPLDAGQHGPNRWRRREDDRDASADDGKENPKTR